jgi:hypothetical protein
MTPRNLFTLVLLFALLGGTSFAKKHHRSDAQALQTILEISPMSVTVDAGKDVQESYTITGATTATLNGLPVKPEDLRAGMVTSIVLASDDQTVESLHAQDAPRTIRKPKPPTDNVNVNVNLK